MTLPFYSGFISVIGGNTLTKNQPKGERGGHHQGLGVGINVRALVGEESRRGLQIADHFISVVKRGEKQMCVFLLARLGVLCSIDLSVLLQSRISCLGNGAIHSGLGPSSSINNQDHPLWSGQSDPSVQAFLSDEHRLCQVDN